MTITSADLRHRGIAIPGEKARERGTARAHRRESGTMNRTEERYAAHLAMRLRAGQIASYAFERVKIRLADKTFLTPDFFVVLTDGSIEFHDTKGRKGDGYWCEEDAKVKIKVAAEIFPARFFIVWECKGGGWNSEEV